MAVETTRAAFLPKVRTVTPKAQIGEGAAELIADAEVYWELVGPHRQKLYNFIRKALSFSESADDVFQETLLRGLKYFASYDREKRFDAWLFTIAHNEVRKYAKAVRRLDPLPLDESLAVTDERVDRALVREVYRLARDFKPRPREIFFLFYDSGFSIAEISKITGVREGNVKFILNRARNTLKALLGGHDEK